MVAPISTSLSESSFSSVKPRTSAALRFLGFSSKWALVAAGALAFGGLLAFGGDLAARGAFAGDGFGDAGCAGAASGETLGAAAGALGARAGVGRRRAHRRELSPSPCPVT